ncbi:MAG: indole-3-glycerol phosphate synthase TrpC [Oscillospiraceae bacterium]
MILDDIVTHRLEQLTREKALLSPEAAKRLAAAAPTPRGFKAALAKDGLSVIAEVKKASPSKGVICAEFDPVRIAHAYEAAGADAVSVLTEEHYFQGDMRYLEAIRGTVSLPLLRKDFIVDAYQIYHARVAGADAVLLICALLDVKTLIEFSAIAHGLGMDCLTEVHDLYELEAAAAADADIIGINNRNLKTFEVNLQTTRVVAENVPDEAILVSESGLRDNTDLRMVRKFGADAVLIGETFMRKAGFSERFEADTAAEMTRLRAGIL